MQNLFDEIMGPGIYDESPAIPTKRQGVCGCQKCRRARKINSLSGESLLDEILDNEASWAEYGFEEIASDSKTSNAPRPGAFYKIQYKKGGLLETAGRAYGVGPGRKRLEYAKLINGHPLNRKFWISPFDSFTKKYL